MASALKTLTENVTSMLSTLPPAETIVETERMQLLGALDQLRVALEPPMVSIQNLCYSAHGIAAVRIAQGMGVFGAFVAAAGEEMTLTELKEKTKGDQELLLRILRLLCASNVVKQTGPNTFKPLTLAMIFCPGSPPGDAIDHFYSQMPVTANLNKYLETTGYRNPGDALDGPLQFGFNTKDHYFDWLTKHPHDQQVFNSVMTLGRAVRAGEWWDYFPIESKLRTSSDNVVLVDIGGGIGHDIKELKANFPQLPGRMMLLDLPQVIESIKDPLPEGVEAMSYDMFTKQPIKGAKAYYMRTVLHDWPDKQALVALNEICKAMAADSVLLLNENTLPATDVPPYAAHLDFTMMEVFSSLERTEQQWLDLIAQAGLRVVKVWKPTALTSASNILIEAALALAQANI